MGINLAWGETSDQTHAIHSCRPLCADRAGSRSRARPPPHAARFGFSCSESAGVWSSPRRSGQRRQSWRNALDRAAARCGSHSRFPSCGAREGIQDPRLRSRRSRQSVPRRHPRAPAPAARSRRDRRLDAQARGAPHAGVPRAGRGAAAARDRPGGTLRAAATRGDGRFLDEPLQCLRRQGPGSVPPAFLYRGNDPPASAGALRGSAHRDGTQPRDAVLSRQCAKRRARVRRFGRNEMPEDRRRRQPTGINENYARELMELHTLGVDGGYTQQDVINVARIFTGWSIEAPDRGSGFVFHDWAHDEGDKVVMGQKFKSDGEDEGIRLLKFLANQHATMHHVSAKLCARFVADEPPDGCVDAAVAAWQTSRGDMRAVLRAIFTSPDFWTSQAVGSKVKTPFEFVVSAVRAAGVEPDDTPRLAQMVARLGEPLYQQPAPTGYAETEAHWVNSGALLARMNAAMVLAKECSSIPTIDDHGQLVDAIDQKLLAGTMSEHTRSVILVQLTDINDPAQARAMAVGLALGGPDFQKQ